MRRCVKEKFLASDITTHFCYCFGVQVKIDVVFPIVCSVSGKCWGLVVRFGTEFEIEDIVAQLVEALNYCS